MHFNVPNLTLISKQICLRQLKISLQQQPLINGALDYPFSLALSASLEQLSKCHVLQSVLLFMWNSLDGWSGIQASTLFFVAYSLLAVFFSHEVST